jgi:hypothetical protein
MMIVHKQNDNNVTETISWINDYQEEEEVIYSQSIQLKISSNKVPTNKKEKQPKFSMSDKSIKDKPKKAKTCSCC